MIHVLEFSISAAQYSWGAKQNGFLNNIQYGARNNCLQLSGIGIFFINRNKCF